MSINNRMDWPGFPLRRFNAGRATVGSPPAQSDTLLPDVEVIRFRIYDFPGRPETQSEYLETEAAIAHGYPWKLRVFPKNRRFVSVFVRYAGNDPPTTGSSMGGKSKNENHGVGNEALVGTKKRPHNSAGVIARADFVCKNLKKVGEIRHYKPNNDWGFEEFLERDLVLGIGTQSGYLDDHGTLVIDVHLQVSVKGPWKAIGDDYRRNIWYPKDTIYMLPNCSDIKNLRHSMGDHDDDSKLTRNRNLAELLFASDEFADITFRVSGVEFKAHKCVLAAKCRTLLEIALESEERLDKNDGEELGNLDSSCPIVELNDVQPRVFQTVLEFIYGVRRNRCVDSGVDNIQATKNEYEDEEYANAILLVGNRFGCSDLKLYAESVIVDKHLTLENAAAYLPLADSHSCAYLKEISMDLITRDLEKSMLTETWYMVEDSRRLLTELLLYKNGNCDYDSEPNANQNDESGTNGKHFAFYAKMDVISLRRRLEELNLSCDGSRRILIHRLMHHDKECERRASAGKDTPNPIARITPVVVSTSRESNVESRLREVDINQA